MLQFFNIYLFYNNWETLLLATVSSMCTIFSFSSILRLPHAETYAGLSDSLIPFYAYVIE